MSDRGADGADLDVILAGLRAARRIEKHGGVTHAQQRHLTAVVDHRTLEASEAGAIDEQIADALALSLTRTRERLRRARAAVPPVVPHDARLAVPQCHAVAPAPWPVWARCRADVGHSGSHRY